MKNNAKSVRILILIGNVILVSLIIVGAIIAFSLLPIKNNYRILVVTSGSMEPEVSVGSMVLVRPSARYEVGDIVTYKQAGETSKSETTTHRIVAIDEEGGAKRFQTRGDANNSADAALISADQIIGKYYFGVAIIGYLIQYLKTLPGLILIIIIPSTIIIYEELRKIGREMKSIKKRKSESE